MADAKPTGGKVSPIIMPQAGNSMEEGTIVKWLVKEGDRISKGQVIFEIETDKANMEVEATEDGRLAKIVAAEGATVAVKQPVAFLSEGDVDAAQTRAEPRSGGRRTTETSPQAPKMCRLIRRQQPHCLQAH